MAAHLPPVPWRLGSDGHDRTLAVGPVALEPDALDRSLRTFGALRTSVAATLAAEPGASDAVGVRLYGTGGTGAPKAVRPRLADVLERLLGPAVADALTVVDDGADLLVRLDARLLPEAVDAAVAAMAAGAAVPGDDPAPARALLTHLWPRAAPLLADEAPDPDPAAPGPTPPLTGESYGPLRIVPFRPGARPVDEAAEPGAGCSEACGFLTEHPGTQRDTAWVLFGIEPDAGPGPFEVRMRAALVPGPHSPLTEPVPVPRLADAAVPARRVDPVAGPIPRLVPARYEPGGSYIAEIDPVHDLLADPAPGAPNGGAPFTFAHLFSGRLRVELALHDGTGARRGVRATEIEVFDVDRLGGLYERLITRLVAVDARAQAAARGVERVYEAYHPWYPVLAIGLAKARLYMRAVTDDIALQQRTLADPAWLMRVGLHLEFLTCLGIVEAVRPEYPDLLTPAERHCVESSSAFAEIRARIDPAAWRSVWGLRAIVFPRSPLTAAGPVDFRNLLTKQTAVLAFLEAHHDDLRHAIELAGPAPGGGQHTWHRVFRDAERAVLDTTHTAFPELRHLRDSYREQVLWHERGSVPFTPAAGVPAWLSDLTGDRDGAYPTAARRYRTSMNEVAAWARGRGLMDFYGEECIAVGASLIEARLRDDREDYEGLQAQDGFGPSPERVRRELAVARAAGGDAVPGPRAPDEDPPDVDVETVTGMLRVSEIFQPLTTAELRALAHRARRRGHGPGEEILRQGQSGTGLHLVEAGGVQVEVTQADGTELVVDRMEAGDLFGEYSLLTGLPASATVRARGPVTVHVIPPSALTPVITARPEVVVELSVLLADRRVNRRSRSEDYLYDDAEALGAGPVGRLAGRMRTFLLG